MLYCLATIAPLHIASGERRIVRVASANSRDITGTGGYIWEPAITQAPVFRVTLFNGDFQAAVSAGAAALPIQMATLKKSFPWADECAWKGAEVEIRVGKPSDAWPWKLAFKGRVSGYERKGQVLALSAEAALDDKDVLTASYAGTGLIEGDADLKGKVKPLAIGWPKNVEPVLINAVDSVYQFSAYGPIEAVTTLYERGSDFGASTGDHADYAALVAATIPAGRWATCLAQGLVRLGAPQAGVITADLKGHIVGTVTPRLTGSIIAALAGIAGIAETDLEADTLDALDLAVPFNVNLNLVDQIKFLDVARRMALPCNHQSGVSLEGKFFVLPISFEATPAFALEAQGRSWPQVIELPIEQETSPPFWRTVLGAERAWRVHSAEEISFSATLIERGPYSDTETYREGNWVSQPDGSTWIYIATEASAGNDPPTWPTASNAWWTYRTAPGGTNSTYADGTPIDDLRPAQPGAGVSLTISGPASANVNYNDTGTTIEAVVDLEYSLAVSGVTATTGVTWSYEVISGTVNGNNSGSGSISMSGAGATTFSATALTTATAVVRIKASHGGIDAAPMDLALTRVLAAPPPVTNDTASKTSGFTAINTATFTDITGSLTLTTPAGKTATSTAISLSPKMLPKTSDQQGPWNIEFKLQRDIASVWTDIGSVQNSSPDPFIEDLTEPPVTVSNAGTMAATISNTGLTASTAYTYRIVARLSTGTPSGNGSTMGFSGSVIITCP